LWAALIFALASALWGVPSRPSRMASTTWGGLGLPRLAAAIFARRAGSAFFAWPLLPPGRGAGLEGQVAAEPVRPLGDRADAEGPAPEANSLRRDAPVVRDSGSALPPHGLGQVAAEDQGPGPLAAAGALAEGPGDQGVGQPGDHQLAPQLAAHGVAVAELRSAVGAEVHAEAVGVGHGAVLL
jgi:hypothetical protein